MISNEEFPRAAVLLVIFNRPETTRRVFSAIREARPPRLYIAADGPRTERNGEREKCAAARAACGPVDWPCEVHTLFHESNLGCRRAVSAALDWFFSKETEGIVLEDDVLPDPSFFAYCEYHLHAFKDDSTIGAIAGCNPVASTYQSLYPTLLSPYMLVWGWATWRRTWLHRDWELAQWPSYRSRGSDWRYGGMSRGSVEMWKETLDYTQAGRIDTWDYQWFFTLFRNRMYVVVPKGSLTKNIGYGCDATHTHGTPPSWVQQMELEPWRMPVEKQAFQKPDLGYARVFEREIYSIHPTTWLRFKTKRLLRLLRLWRDR